MDTDGDRAPSSTATGATSEATGDARSPRMRRFVVWALRRGGWLWFIALLLAIPATWRTASLYANLRSDIEELLPSDAPSVRAIAELRERMRGLQFLGVLVDVGENASPDRLKAAERLIDDLAARVRAYPAGGVADVRTGFAAERAFVERHAPLLIELEDLQLIRQRIEDRLHYEYAKQTNTLLDESEPAPPLDFSDIERRYAANAAVVGDLVGGRFSSQRYGRSLLLIEVGGFSTSARQATALVDRVRADIEALGGANAYAPGLTVGFTGDIAISAEETAALMEDLTISSVFVIVAVMLALVLYYRWVASMIALLVPLALATVYAFGLASLVGIRELNSNTAFLGSIIIGNGINFGIIQLARYVEARRRGRRIVEALEVSLHSTRVGTLSAALAAAVAYASLIAMQFRGFRQFGVIGGLGMVMAWVTTFVLGPSLIAWLDRGRVARDWPRTLSTDRRSTVVVVPRPTAALARWVARRPIAIAIASSILTVLAIVEVRRFGAGELEYDFSRMRRADTWRAGEGYWGRKMDEMLGQYLTPTVLLVDSQQETRSVEQALRAAMKKPPLADMIASIRTVEDLVPPDQDARRAEVEEIRRKLTPNVRDALSPKDRQKLEQMLGESPIPPIRRPDVPDALLKGLQERDGRTDRAVLVYPRLDSTLWQGPTNATFIEALRQVARAPERTGGRAARVAGGLPLSADIIASMNRDGPLASLLAFVGVVLTVVLLFRRRLATPLVIGSLVLGVLWLLALAMVLKIKINFINFIAFPITFGIGVDYAVNVMARYLADGTGDVAAAIRGTGSAVALCSLTTILGYSSLLVAQNLGLFFFGLLAVLGEIVCLSTAVIVMPAVLALTRRS